MSNAANAVKACLDGLRGYLNGAGISGLTVYSEWPYGNQKLKLPGVTLFSGTPKIMNQPFEIIAKTTPDSNNQIVVTEITGRVDLKIQLDLWTGDKFTRDTYLGLIMDAIDAKAGDDSSTPGGLSLQLTNYFNDWVRYDIDGFTYIDDEAAAQRQERRAKIDLLVNCRVIRQRTIYAMVTVDVLAGTAGNIPLTADSNSTETITI